MFIPAAELRGIQINKERAPLFTMDKKLHEKVKAKKNVQ
jgi:hypothetical protein